MSEKYYELKADMHYYVMIRKCHIKDSFRLLNELWKLEDRLEPYFERKQINSVEFCGLVKLMYYWAGMRLECPF